MSLTNVVVTNQVMLDKVTQEFEKLSEKKQKWKL
jgi:hypothetical protein